MADTPLQAPVLIAVVGGAHGIRGEVRVKSFTEDPEDVGAYGPLFDAKGVRYTVKSARFHFRAVRESTQPFNQLDREPFRSL